MKKMFVTAVSAVLVLAAVVLGSFTAIYFTRLQTIGTIEKVTDDTDYNLYRMDVKYHYRIQDVIDYGITDTQTFVDAILKEALPLLPVQIDVPDFGCSAFTMEDVEGNILMGRNYFRIRGMAFTDMEESVLMSSKQFWQQTKDAAQGTPDGKHL